MANKKITIFKFNEEEIAMYNSMMIGAMSKIMFNRMSEAGISYDKIITEIFPIDYVRGDFQEDLDHEIDEATNGTFSMDLFKYEEEIEDE